MTAATPVLRAVARHPDEARLSRRAATSLVALLAAALTSVGIVLSHSIRQQQQSRVAAHLGAVVQGALREISHEADQAQQQAMALAAEPQVQQALEGNDERALAHLTASTPGAAAAFRTQSLPATTQPALRRTVRVFAKGKLVGTVAVALPLDGAMLSRLEAATGLIPGEGILFVRGGRILDGPPGVSDARVPPDAQSVRLDGTGYSVSQATLVASPERIQLVAFAPAAEISRPVARSERLLVACLVVTFFALLLLARFLAQPALAGPLSRLALDARSSGIDDLTSLPNRRAFAEAAAAELVRARRTGRPLAVAVIDIDDFKQVNDTFGHSTGDRILCDVASVLREHFREIDLPARMGGEEFAVLLPETDLAGAREAVERFVSALAAAELGDGQSRPYGVTASAGVAAAPDLGVDVLLERADRALYRAKEHGKNQVCADPPDSPDHPAAPL